MRMFGLFAGTALAAIVLAGCGGNELRTASQGSDFIRDIAAGGSIADWTHEGGAVSFADSAWYNRNEIENLGTRLREEGVEWACDTAGWVNSAAAAIEGGGLGISEEEHESIVYSAEREGIQEVSVNSLIDEILALGSSEGLETVDSACQAAREF